MKLEEQGPFMKILTLQKFRAITVCRMYDCLHSDIL